MPMKLAPSLVGLSQRLGSFLRDRRGTSAIEFAMLLPLLVTLYLGTVEITQGIGINRKVTLTTRTVADLATQVSSISDSDMTTLLGASATVMGCDATKPKQCDTTQLKVTVSEVKIDANQVAKVAWSDTLNGTKRAVGSAVSLPAALKVANTNLIWGEVSYDYKPTVGYVITGTLKLSDQIFMRPRLSDCVTRSTGSSQVC
jgi:Flp pilus assembly protein TadG